MERLFWMRVAGWYAVVHFITYAYRAAMSMDAYVKNEYTLVTTCPGLANVHGGCIQQWPSDVTAKCLYDGCTFRGTPVTVALDFRTHQATGATTFWVCGTFCSWACAAAWLESQTDEVYQKALRNLEFFARKVFGYPPKQAIVAAKNKELIKEYGGPFTVDEWRRQFTRHAEIQFSVTTSRVCPYPLVLWAKRSGKLLNGLGKEGMEVVAKRTANAQSLREKALGRTNPLLSMMRSKC